jgi:hypothetical protein
MVPWSAETTTSTLPEPASTSATLIALPPPLENTRPVSSLMACVVGTVFTGWSLTAVTVRSRTRVLLASVPSSTRNESVRVAVLGSSLVLANVTDRRAAWWSAGDALPVSSRTPVAALKLAVMPTGGLAASTSAPD